MTTVATGGKRIYGAALGILMLESRFPRIPGDIGNARTWDFPVLYKVVPGASPDRVVRRRAEGLRDSFIEAARELVETGAEALTTNCGFLTLFQEDLARAVPVPVATSSLMQVPMIRKMLPSGQDVGILTISAETLTQEHLDAAGIEPGIDVEGTDSGKEFSRVILDDEAELDVELARQDLLEAAERLIARNSRVTTILLECTNMCPYARDIARHTGCAVFDITTFVNWFHAALRPVAYEQPWGVRRDNQE